MKLKSSISIVFLIVVFFLSFQNIQAEEDIEIVLQIGNPYMYVNNAQREIDPGRNTKPVIVNSRTLLPIRAIVENIGGTIEWEDATKKVTIKNDDTIIILWIGSFTTLVNDINVEIDVAPQIINARTMMPLRFITESLGCNVEWFDKTKEVLITKSSESTGDTSLNALLLKACENNNIPKILECLDNGANVNYIDSNGLSPIIIASTKGNNDMIALLLENGADINLVDQNTGYSPLMFAIALSYPDTASFLIQNSADVNAYSKNSGISSLMLAIGDSALVTDLIKNGADVNMKTFDGITALMYAAMYDDLDSAMILIENGANVNYKNVFGATALMMAKEKGSAKMVSVLESAGAKE